MTKELRADDWENIATGLGTDRDKGTYSEFIAGTRLTDQQCSALYHHDDLAKTIISTVPEEALRPGWKVVCSDPDSEPKVTKVEQVLTALEASQNLKAAWIWGRAFGGGAILLGATGSGPPQAPLVEERVKSIDFLTVLDKRDLHPFSFYGDPFKPKFGQVETYQLNQYALGVTPTPLVIIHETRLVLFGGALTARQEKLNNNLWDHSVLQPVINVLRKSNTVLDSVAAMMNDASQGVYKLQGLIDGLSEEDNGVLQTRMAVMDKMRSITRAIILDADTEDYKLVERQTLSGMAEILDRTVLRVASAARMPVTILMGQSPAGMNATGEADLRWFANSVKAAQTDVLKPRLLRLLKLVVKVTFPQDDVDRWDVEFCNLFEPTAVERAIIDKTEAETAQIRAAIARPDSVLPRNQDLGTVLA